MMKSLTLVCILTCTMPLICSQNTSFDEEPSCLKESSVLVATYVSIIKCDDAANGHQDRAQRFSTCFKHKIDTDTAFKSLTPGQKNQLRLFVMSALSEGNSFRAETGKDIFLHHFMRYDTERRRHRKELPSKFEL